MEIKNIIQLCLCLILSGCGNISSGEVDLDKINKSFLERKPKDIFLDKSLLELAEAASKGNVKKIEELVKLGVDVNGQGWAGFTPLFSALNAENKKGVESLLKAGANPNLLDDGGEAPIHFAAQWIHNPEFLGLLLKYGGDPNLPDKDDLCSLPLIDASFGSISSDKAKEKIRLLISYGGELNSRNDSCEMPIPIPEWTPHTVLVGTLPRYDLIYYMLENGADPDFASLSGVSLTTAIKKMGDDSTISKEQKLWKQKVLEFIDNR